jgi:hypothetical protein
MSDVKRDAAFRQEAGLQLKTANVLNKVALSVQLNMKADLREIYGAPTPRRPRRRSTCSPTNTAPSTTKRSAA